jgi:XTP/dITP diphosphohydrolase
MQLILATRNAHKTGEIQRLLGREIALRDLAHHPEISEVDESGSTFEENALLKAVTVSKELPGLVIADDSGLEVVALGGAPGIYSARYAGQSATDEQNIRKLLGELARRNVPSEGRGARFRCVIALARGGKSLGLFEGVIEGTIVDPPRGRGGFGYDPVFQPTGFNQTFGEMEPELKNRVSHRAKAIAALQKALSNTRRL